MATRLLARGVHDFRVAFFFRGHRRDDRELALEHRVVEIGILKLFFHLAEAGHHAHQARHAAHLLHLFELVGEVFEVENPFLHSGSHLGCLVLVYGLGGFFNQRDHVTHAEDARCNTFGMEVLEPVEFFTSAQQFDRFAGDRAHRQGGAAATVTVDSGQDKTGYADLFVERAGQVDRILAGQGIGDQQGFGRFGDIADGLDFRHEFFVDEQPPGRVQHDHVIARPSWLPTWRVW